MRQDCSWPSVLGWRTKPGDQGFVVAAQRRHRLQNRAARARIEGKGRACHFDSIFALRASSRQDHAINFTSAKSQAIAPDDRLFAHCIRVEHQNPELGRHST